MLRKPIYQYNYALRYLIERVSKYAASKAERAVVIIEKRRNFDLDEFRRYMNLLRSRNDANFEWRWFSPDDLRVEDKRSCSELCVADALAHGLFKALEPDRKWRNLEPVYFEALQPKLWTGTKHDQLMDNGLVLMPRSDFGTYLQEYNWLAALLR